MEQDILIYIDDKEKLDASATANTFAHKDVKNRAYINTLGAELALKYLVSENIDVSEAKNIHSIKKILEEMDIADIILPNIHIDVRVVFDENAIFIPKSHFEYELTPDIYLVFNLAKDHSYVKFLGFFEPKLINKNNANSEYYFIEKEKLNSAHDLLNYINSHKDTAVSNLSEQDIETSERFIISMSDHDISENDKKYLIKQLLKSAELRDKFIEYENFETLSYKAMNDPMIEKKEIPNIETTFTDEPVDMDLSAIETVDENIAEETISLEELPELEADETPIEPAEEEINTDETISLDDNLEQLENIEEPLSLDSIELPQETIEPDTADFADIPEIAIEPLEPISPDTVELPQDTTELNITDLADISETAIEPPETISLDTIELPQEEIFEEPVIDTISLETVEIPEPEISTETNDIETISLDNIEVPENNEEILQPEVDMLSLDMEIPSLTEEIPVAEQEILTDIPDIIEADAPNNEITPFDNTENETSPEDIIDNLTEIPDIIEADDTLTGFEDITEDTPQENNDSSFGKNLLENLSEENSENILIEENVEPETSEDISSSDLLSQIDDVLSSSNVADIHEDIPTDDIDTLLEETDELNVLYDPSQAEQPITSDEAIQEEPLPAIPGSALYNKKSTNNKKSAVVAGALIAILAASGTFMFLKQKNNNTADVEALPVNNQAPVQETTPEDILTSNTPQAPVKKDIEATKPVVKELKNNLPKPTNSEAYLSVNKLVWDVPDTLSYNTKIQNYLRTAGRSIKLTLSADLLLATEYAYTNQVKVGLKLSKDGAIQEAQILSGSGSTEIDNIVLQSVKDTLNVVKPPADEIKTPDFNLNLIIYF